MPHLLPVVSVVVAKYCAGLVFLTFEWSQVKQVTDPNGIVTRR